MKKIIMFCFCMLAIFLLHGAAFGSFNFIDNGDGTVTDARTGLVWLKNANPCGNINWYDAGTCCNSLASGPAGLTDGSVAGDWRLPSKEELQEIGTDPPTTWLYGTPSVTWTTPGTPFTNVQSYYYWSSTIGAQGPNTAWIVHMYNGHAYYGVLSDPSLVWPVRGYVEITTSTTIQPTTTTTICDGDYWKNLYEQTKAELEACQNPVTTTVLPTNIELSILDAKPSDKKVLLRWRTESETDNAGYNIWRAEGFVKVNESIIPALGSAISGSDYDFIDEWVLNGKRYFYLLEDVNTNGISTFHGPVKAKPRWWLRVGW